MMKTPVRSVGKCLSRHRVGLFLVSQPLLSHSNKLTGVSEHSQKGGAQDFAEQVIDQPGYFAMNSRTIPRNRSSKIAKTFFSTALGIFL